MILDEPASTDKLKPCL